MDCWHRELERSGTEADVVQSASDFLALWSPRELEPLTLGWRDLRIEGAADIERMKRWLVDEAAELAIGPGAGELRELGDYFWHAAMRIEELRAQR
jgi:hypothetical protein